MDVVAVLGRYVGEPLGSEGELRVKTDVAIADHLQHLGLVGDDADVRNREFTAEVPVRGPFAVSELVVEDAVGPVFAGAVGPFEEHLAPDVGPGVGDDERAGVVVAEKGPLPGEAVLLGKFRTRVVAVADLLADAAFVEFALAVDQLAVEVEEHFCAVLLEFGDGLPPPFVAALGRIGVVVGIAVVHARLPPPEGEGGIGPDALPDALDAPGQVSVLEEQLPVLVAEDDALPAPHLLHPHGGIAVIPPGVGPAAVEFRGLMPCARVGGNDVGVAAPAFTREAVGIFVESRLQTGEVPLPVGVEAQSVSRVLELRIVAPEIEPLALADIGEAVRGHAASGPARHGPHGIFGVHLSELLCRGLVG